MGENSDMPTIGRRHEPPDAVKDREALISHVDVRVATEDEGARWLERAAEASLVGHFYAHVDSATLARLSTITQPDEWARHALKAGDWDAGARACVRAVTDHLEFEAVHGFARLFHRMCPAEATALVAALNATLRGAGGLDTTVFIRDAPKTHARLRFKASFSPNNPATPDQGGVLFGTIAAAAEDPPASVTHTGELRAGFLASLSHEIRTPLSGVLGMLDLMMSSQLTSDQRELGHMAQGAARTLRRLIDDVLDLSKIEAGKLDLERIPLSLRRIVRDAARAIAPAAHAKGLDVTLDVHIDHDEREGDPTRLSQVLLNLLGNAVKFTDTGYIAVSVTHAPPLPSQPDTPAVRIRVEDTGVGIAPDRAATLFSPFAQADASVSRRYGGTGLGLAISRQLCEAMGGHIHAIPGASVGTTFELVLPLPMASRDPHLKRERRRLTASQTGEIPAVDNSRIPHRVGVFASPQLTKSLSAGLSRAGFDIYSGDTLHPDAEVLVLDTFFGRANDEMTAWATAAAKAKIPVLALTDTSQLLPEGLRSLVTRTLIKPVLPYDVYRLLCELGDESEEPVRSFSIAPPPPTRPLTVLVAEDNPVNALLAKSLLSRLGHKPVMASNGREALTLLQSGATFDVVLMDVLMPEMDGLEATRAIRSSPFAFRDIPVVALTAKALEGDENACRAAGMNEYLTKPFNVHDLRDTLARLVERRTQPEAER